MKSGFLDKLIEKLDRVDPEQIQRYVLKAVQEKGFLENVFDTLQEGIVVVGLQGNIHYVNQAALDFFGFTRQELIGQRVADQFPGIGWENIARGNRSITRELEVFYPEHRFLNFYISPLEQKPEESSSDELETSGYVIILRDETKNRRAQQEEVESERIAALTMLAASVAHELGNPLNSLHIHLQLLERKLKKNAPPELVGEMVESLDIARSEVKRLSYIIEKFLGSVRPAEPQLEFININQVVEEAVTFLAPEVQDRNITITLQLNQELPRLIVDADQLKQVFYNLIRNSAQAIGSDGNIIINTDHDDYRINISFADDGPGLPAEEVGKVFNPYFTTKKTGSGLGLLIVHRIIREHGGKIEFESKEHEGTTANISLPRAEQRTRFLPEDGASGVINVGPIDDAPPSNK